VVYGRRYGEHELKFEASGGLMHASLVMQDKETDTYWSIMTGGAVAGELEGTKLEELPLSVKVQWKDWVATHPETMVLSVDGVEHIDENPYEDYFESEEGFHGITAEDERLATKTPIYAFWHDGAPYAVAHEEFAGGGAFELGEQTMFLYRPTGAEVFSSTLAFLVPEKVTRSGGEWTTASGATYNDETGEFTGTGSDRIRPPQGFDTFWFNWSLTNPNTEVLSGS
jgi:hypothetical protein